jgi:hypothetical protein
VSGFEPLVRIAQKNTKPRDPKHEIEKYLSSSKHPLYPISIRGGRYMGIYDTGFKRGFIGYRGLLLNAP